MSRGTRCYFLGFEFDSKGECERAKYLYALEQEGVISNLVLDKTLLNLVVSEGYVLPAIHPFHKRIKVAEITYTPDYKYEFGGYTFLEDYKALRRGKPFIERDSRLRMKLARTLLPPLHILRVCFDVTAEPDAQKGYHYR